MGNFVAFYNSIYGGAPDDRTVAMADRFRRGIENRDYDPLEALAFLQACETSRFQATYENLANLPAQLAKSGEAVEARIEKQMNGAVAAIKGVTQQAVNEIHQSVNGAFTADFKESILRKVTPEVMSMMERAAEKFYSLKDWRLIGMFVLVGASAGAFFLLLGACLQVKYQIFKP